MDFRDIPHILRVQIYDKFYNNNHKAKIIFKFKFNIIDFPSIALIIKQNKKTDFQINESPFLF